MFNCLNYNDKLLLRGATIAAPVVGGGGVHLKQDVEWAIQAVGDMTFHQSARRGKRTRSRVRPESTVAAETVYLLETRLS